MNRSTRRSDGLPRSLFGALLGVLLGACLAAPALEAQGPPSPVRVRPVTRAQVEDRTLVTGDLRAALHELGAITGEITNEDMLDQIFSRFCIGK